MIKHNGKDLPLNEIIYDYITTRYICNEAVCTTEEKSTTDWDKVTCKNYLKRKNDKNK